MKKHIVFIILALLILPSVFAEVTRTFEKINIKPNEIVKVTYVPSSGDWILDEVLPAGWKVQNVEIYQQHLRNYFTSAEKVEYIFVAPSVTGTYTFDKGLYQIGNNENFVNLPLQTITVSNEGQSCIPKWKTTDWSDCVDGKQTRSCTDENNCNISCPLEIKKDCIKIVCGNGICEGNEDVENCPQDCLKCEEKWECGEWSYCVDEEQTRICTDLNNCRSEINKPEEKRECSNTILLIMVLIAILIFLSIVLYFLLIKRKKVLKLKASLKSLIKPFK